MNNKEVTKQFFNQLMREHVTGELVTLAPEQLAHVDPEGLLYLLTEHKLKSTLASLVQKYLPNSFSLQKQLINFRKQETIRYLQMTNGLMALGQALQQQHILFVVLKGLPLNAQLYGKQYLRTMSDLDVLITPESLFNAHHCLLGLGYQLKTEISLEHLTAENLNFLLEFTKDICYWHPQQKILLELHWKTMRTKGVGIDSLSTEKIIPCAISDNFQVNVFNPEYNFVYLCFHAGSHSWQRLQWLVDLAIFYQKNNLNWQKVITLAKQYDGMRYLLQAKILLKSQLGLQLPEIPVSNRDQRVVNFHLNYINKNIINVIDKVYVPSKISVWKTLLFYTLVFTKFKQKKDFLLGLFWHRNYGLKQLQYKPNRSKITMVGLSIFDIVFKWLGVKSKS